jgi:flagellar motor component MotA
MIRYLFSLIVFFAGIILAIFTSGGNAWTYVDIPSLIIVGIFPFFFASVLFGFKEMGLAFSVSIRKETEKEKLIKAFDFFRIYGKVTWIAGFIAVLIGVNCNIKTFRR